jgi:hypothetical protein
VTLPASPTAVAVNALRDKVRALLPAPPAADAVVVYDGPAPERAFMGRAVTIGEAFEDDQDPIAEEREESGARPTFRTTVTVAGSVYVGGGGASSVEWADYRAQAGAILWAIDDGLRGDRTLGGAVSLARMSRSSWIQGRDTKGAGVAIGFAVELISLS